MGISWQNLTFDSIKSWEGITVRDCQYPDLAEISSISCSARNTKWRLILRWELRESGSFCILVFPRPVVQKWAHHSRQSVLSLCHRCTYWQVMRLASILKKWYGYSRSKSSLRRHPPETGRARHCTKWPFIKDVRTEGGRGHNTGAQKGRLSEFADKGGWQDPKFCGHPLWMVL